jgi:hypothetical protein
VLLPAAGLHNLGQRRRKRTGQTCGVSCTYRVLNKPNVLCFY